MRRCESIQRFRVSGFRAPFGHLFSEVHVHTVYEHINILRIIQSKTPVSLDAHEIHGMHLEDARIRARNSAETAE